MQRAVLAFANTLRKNGIRISVDEVLCALTGIELIDLASRAQFRTLLKTTWIKRADDIKEFDRLFELFFADFSVPEEALLRSLAPGELQAHLQEVLDQAGMEAAAINWLIPHQANIRIIQSTAKKLGLPMDKVITTVDRHGNTSAASIPLALDSAVRSGRVRREEILMLEGVGGGFTWGAVLLKF